MTEQVCCICAKTMPLARFERLPDTTAGNPIYRKKCFDCRNEERAAHNTSTPEQYLRRAVSSLKYTRKKEGVTFLITAQDAIDTYYEQGGKCAITGLSLTHERTGKRGPQRWTDNPFNITIDRINPDGPYVPSNIVLTCKLANYARGVMPLHDFIDLCELVTQHCSRSSLEGLDIKDCVGPTP